MATPDRDDAATPAAEEPTLNARPVPTSPPSLDDGSIAPPPGDPRTEEAERRGEQAKRDDESYWAYVKRQYRKNPLARIALWFIILLAAVAVLADFLANDKPILCSFNGTLRSPVIQEYLVGMGLDTWSPDIAAALEKSEDSWRTLTYDWAIFPPVPYKASEADIMSSLNAPFEGEHLLGTDQTGRDVLAGLIHGTRISLTIGFVAMGIAALIGVILGALAGYFGGWVDITISRLIEVFLNFPTLFLVLAIVALLEESNIFVVMAVIGVTGWMGIARLMRGEVLRIRAMEYVAAANSLGFSNTRIIFRHVLPNAIGPVLVSVAFGIAGSILTESTLSFLGFGVPTETVTWGSLLDQARRDPLSWWLGIFPGIMIFLTVVSYNLIGDGLRDATDPRLRQ